MLLWVNKIAYAFLGGNGAPDFSQKDDVPCVPERFQVGASGSPTACQEDFGDDDVCQSCSHFRAQSLFSELRIFAESAANGIDCLASPTGS